MRAKPGAAPVQDGMLEGGLPIEEKGREPWDQERGWFHARMRRGVAVGQPEGGDGSGWERAGEGGAFPGDRGRDTPQVNRRNGECGLKRRIAPPQVFKGSRRKLLKHPRGQDVIPSTQSRRDGIRKEGGVVGEMGPPRFADIKAIGKMNRRGNEVDL